MSGSQQIGLVWFRRDLRLHDNPAWATATSERDAVIPLFVLDPRLVAQAGPYRRRQLVASLQALDYDLFERVGGRLLVRIGDPAVLVPEAVEVLQAGSVYWNGDTTPHARRRDRAVRDSLGVEVTETWGTLVHPPGAVRDGDGAVPRDPSAYLERWRGTASDPWPDAGDAIVYDDPGEPIPRLDGRPPLPEGEGEAQRRLDLLAARLDALGDGGVDPRLDPDPSSHLSVDLHLGVLSPRVVRAVVGEGTPARDAIGAGLARRDQFAHLAAEGELDPEVADADPRTSWRDDRLGTSAWKGGFTGYPVIDAAMRQLRDTGWMPGPARRLTARFLVDALGVDWRIGEQHFRHLLVDGDVAQNLGNWTAVAAGSSALDVEAEGRRLDPSGAYVQRWVPELAGLDGALVHAPWAAAPDALGGITLGADYPDRVPTPGRVGSDDGAPAAVSSPAHPDGPPTPSDG